MVIVEASLNAFCRRSRGRQAQPRKQVALESAKTHGAADFELWCVLDTPFASRPKTVLMKLVCFRVVVFKSGRVRLIS